MSLLFNRNCNSLFRNVLFQGQNRPVVRFRRSNSSQFDEIRVAGFVTSLSLYLGWETANVGLLDPDRGFHVRFSLNLLGCKVLHEHGSTDQREKGERNRKSAWHIVE